MVRLPIPGSDDGTWGEILNEFLLKGHNPDGSHKTIPVSQGGTGATSAAGARSSIGAASDAALTAHIQDDAAAHAAQAIAFEPFGTITAESVQVAIEQVATQAGATIVLSSNNPSNLAAAASAGTSSEVARADHTHSYAGLATDAELADHANANTFVHGIANTANLETKEGAQAKADAAQAAASAALTAHTTDTIDAHAASAITFTPTGSIVATNVQAAVAELLGDTNTLATSIANHASAADPHTQYLTNTRHDALDHTAALASAALADLGNVASTSPIADQVLTWDGSAWAPADMPAGVTDHGALTGLSDDDHPQYLLKAGGTMTGALTLSGAPTSDSHATTKLYVDTGISTVSGALDGHLSDTTDAHDASAISFTPTGSIAATDVQSAIAELESESAAGVSAALAAHEADTTDVHGIADTTQLETQAGAQAKADAAQTAAEQAASDDLAAHIAALDPHSQYLTVAEHAAIDAADHGSGSATDGFVLTSDGSGGAAWEALPTSDHGALSGLSDDDHPQYLLTSGNRTTTGINLTSAATGTDALTFRVSGDSTSRLIINAGGSLEWGAGTGGVDTNLYRGGADDLRTDDRFGVIRTVTTDSAFIASIATDTNARFTVSAGGSLEWGPGNSAGDTVLYRPGAGRLKTDTDFEVGGNLLLSTDPTDDLHAAPKQYVDTLVSSHETDTTNVHGIADTTQLETQTGAQTKADTAVSDHEGAADPHTQYLTAVRHDSLDHSAAFATAVLADLADVDATAPSSGNVLKWDGDSWAPSDETGVTDHGALTGLTDDDHAQYLLTSGTRSTSGVILLATDDTDTPLTLKGTATQSGDILQLYKGSEANPFLAITHDGTIQLGAGADDAVDTTLYRASSGMLATSGAFLANDFFSGGSIVLSGSSSGLVSSALAESFTPFLTSQVTGDSNSRFQVSAEGEMSWGDGTATHDTALYRSAASTLRTDGTIVASATLRSFDGDPGQVALTTISGQAGILFGSAGDTNLYRSAANTLKTDDSLIVSGTITLADDPINPMEVSTKQYVDSIAAGLGPKASVLAATTANITLSGEQTIDGIAVTAGERVLVKDQTDGSENGIYVASAGAWSRASDADTNTKVISGIFCFVEEGTENGQVAWVLSTPNPIDLGTTPLEFVRLSAVTDHAGLSGLDDDDHPQYVLRDDTRGAADDNALAVRVSGDTQARFVLNGEGSLEWSNGSAVIDTKLYRSDISTLTTDGDFTVGGSLTIGGSSLLIGGEEAATKAYVDALANGLDPKESVRVATTGNITLSGEQSIDGVAVSSGDRVLVKDQTDATKNGIYTVDAAAWSRAVDADETGKINPGAFMFVEEGTVNGNTGWVLTTNDPITLNTTSLTFQKFTAVISHSALQNLTQDDHPQYLLTNGTRTTSGINLNATASTSDILNLSVTGDANARLIVNADGRMEWGPGNATVDTNLYRSAASTLKTDDNLEVALDVRAGDIYGKYGAAEQVKVGNTGSGAGLVFGTAGDTNLYRSAADVLRTDDQFHGALGAVFEGGDVRIDRTSTTSFRVRSSGGTAKFTVDVSGDKLIPGAGVKIEWDGDTNLYRSAANTLKTDDSFHATSQLVARAGLPEQVTIGTGGANADIIFGSAGDTNLYRSGANVLKTDDSFEVGGDLTLANNPTQDMHAATKSYVDAVATGLDPKASVRVATTANITLSGTQTIDSVAVIAGDRVLVKNQTTASQNGIYIVAAGAWSRSTDADVSSEVTPGMFCFVEEGTTNGNTGWVLVTDAPITLGTTNLSFERFTSQNDHGVLQGLTDDDHTQYLLASGERTTTGVILTAASAGTDSLSLKVTGDANARHVINADGSLEWGDGAGTADTNLYRSAADTLKTDDSVVVDGASGITVTNGNLSVNGGRFITGLVGGNAGFSIGTDASPIQVYRNAANKLGIKNISSGLLIEDGPLIVAASSGKNSLQLTSTGSDTGITLGTDTNLYRSAADTLKTDDTLIVAGTNGLQLTTGPVDATLAATTTSAFLAKVTGDSVYRVKVSADGKLEWGSGSATRDTNLYRSAADTLKTDDNFEVAGNLSVTGTLTVGGSSVDLTNIAYTDVAQTFTAAQTVSASPSTGAFVLSAVRSDAGTNNIEPVLNIKRTSSGTTAAGFGAAIHFTLEDLGGNDDRTAAQIVGLWESGDSNYEGALAFYTRDGVAGAAETMRLTHKGNLGIGRTAPVSRLEIAPQSVAIPSGSTAITTLYSRGGASFTTDISNASITGNVYGINFDEPQLTATSSKTVPLASTVVIGGAPIAGTNVTITEGHALRVAGGTSYFGGNMGLGVNPTTSKLQFAAATTAAGGITFGTDTNLYRSAADWLKTDDSLEVTGQLKAASIADTDGALELVITGTTKYTFNGSNLVFADGQGIQVGTTTGTIIGTTTAQKIGFFGATPLANTLALADNSIVQWGTDTNLYRGAANILHTDDQLESSVNILAQSSNAARVIVGQAGPSNESGIVLGSAGDTNLYRSAANTLKTDDSVEVSGDLTVTGTLTANGVEIGAAVEPEDIAAFATEGTITVKTGKGRYLLPFAATILGVSAAISTAPTGASVIVDVNKNGTTIFTTQANRPTIAAGSNATASEVTNMDVTALSAGDYITIDIDQVGSTVAGSDLTVFIRYQKV